MNEAFREVEGEKPTVPSHTEMTSEEVETAAQKFQVENSGADSERVAELQELADEVQAAVQAVINANAKHTLAEGSDARLAAIEENKQTREALSEKLDEVIREGELAMAMAVQAARFAGRGDWSASFEAGNDLLNGAQMGFDKFTTMSTDTLDAKIEELKTRGF